MSQMVFYFATKKDRPNHIGYIKIDLSKMTIWPFLCVEMTSFLLDSQLK
jgi:hypothetical protein